MRSALKLDLLAVALKILAGQVLVLFELARPRPHVPPSISGVARQTPNVCWLRSEPVSQVVWARDGTIAAVITESSLRVVAGDSLQPIGDVTAPHANAAAFSDSSELLLTHQRAFKQDGNPGKNLIVRGPLAGHLLLIYKLGGTMA